MPICAEVAPPLLPQAPGQAVACHLYPAPASDQSAPPSRDEPAPPNRDGPEPPAARRPERTSARREESTCHARSASPPPRWAPPRKTPPRTRPGWLGPIYQARAQDVELIAFPELALTTYFPTRVHDADWERYFEDSLDSPTVTPIRAAARAAGMALILPFAERAAHGCFNSAAIFDADGDLLGHYRKVHIPGTQYRWARSRTRWSDGTSSTAISASPSTRAALVGWAC